MSNVWDRTTEFLSDNLGAVVSVAIPTIFLPISVQTSLSGMLAGMTPGDPSQLGAQLVNLVMSLLLMLGGLAIVALGTGAALAAGEALVLAARRFLLAVLVVIVLLVALAVISLPLFGMMMSAGVQMMQGRLVPLGSIPPQLGLAISAYAFLVVLVLLWVGARLVLVNSVILAEGRGLSALARSWQLTRGMVFKIIGVLILFGVVQGVATLATRTVVGTILQLLTNDTGPLSTATVITAVLTGAVAAGFAVLGFAFIAKLFLAARGAMTPPVEVA